MYSIALKSPLMEEWKKSNADEFIKLIDTIKTMHLIHFADILPDRQGDIRYNNPQVKENYKDETIERRNCRIIGGNVIGYPGLTSSRTASLETVKILINSADLPMSTSPHAISMISTSALLCPVQNTDVQNISKFSTKLCANLIINKDVVYVQVNKGMNGLKQAGLLANKRIVERLAKYDYIQSKCVPCLFVT